MNDRPVPTIGFVGAGRIGEPMVERLLDAGHRVLLHVRRAEVRERLELRGAEPVESLTELGTADVVVSCLYDDVQFEAVLGEAGLAPALQPGTIVVSHTTGTPAALLRVADAAASRGAAVVEAPFSGTPAQIRSGELTVLLGGRETDLDTVEPVLRAYASPILRTGVLGSALRVKLLNNLLFAAISQLTLTATAAGARMGIDEATLLAALRVSSGASAAGGHIERFGGSAPYAEAITPFLQKDVAACTEVAAELGVDIAALLTTAAGGPLLLVAQA